MELQPMRQLDYLQRTLSIFLANPADISEQFEALIKDLIKENKQSGKSPKTSPEPIASDSKPEAPAASSPPHPLPKKRSAPLTANTKPPPSKRLKSTATKDEEPSAKKPKTPAEEKPTAMEKDDDIYDDGNSSDDSKSKSSESQDNPSTSATSRGIDEFVIEMGLVCSKCMVLTEEKDNRLVECHECRTKYHQKCHKPAVSTSDISDPRCLWYCSKCRKVINKRQQPQSSIKESKTNSNASTLNNKSKPLESPLSAGKKGLLTSITDVPAGIFSFKPKSSESITSDGTTTSNPSASSSTSSLSNGTTPKSTNAWASLATGCKEKKTTPESPCTSASSVLTELSALTSSSNSNAVKRSPPSPKSLSSTSLNPLLRPTSNGGTTSSVSSLKNASSSGKPNTPSSPPVLKTQLSSSKSTQKLLPTTKPIQRVSSPTPLGRPTSLLKSPPPTATPAYNRLNSSGSNSSGSSSPSSAPNANVKIATGLDFGKRLKELQKKAAEKSLTKKF